MTKTLLTLFILTQIAFFGCQKNTSSSRQSQIEFARSEKSFEDSVLNNNESVGSFVYTHLKYYLGTVNIDSIFPDKTPTEVENLKQSLTEKFANADKVGSEQTFKQLADNKSISQNELKYLLNDTKSLTDLLSSDLITKTASDESDIVLQNINSYFISAEHAIRVDENLTLEEKNFLLLHHSIVKNTLRWKVGNSRKLLKSTATVTDMSTEVQGNFWSTIACYAGSVSTYAGIATAFTGGNVIAAVVGAVVGAVNAVFTCNGSSKNVCQDPLTVSVPYRCYTIGSPLTFTAVGYGNTKPAQFVFSVTDNDNLNNALWSNFTSNSYISIPGSYLTSAIKDVAVLCKTSCSAGNPLWFGWFTLSDLGKPYFTISGSTMMPASQTHIETQYSAVGPVGESGATITWSIQSISGGANGTIAQPHNQTTYIQWNPTPGYAILTCTATTGCTTISNSTRMIITAN